MHVDACIGGFLLPFLDIGGWAFDVPGVTSVSLDLHKFGYAPKGASLVLYRGRQRHLEQYVASVAWPGCPVVNPAAFGSRSATACVSSATPHLACSRSPTTAESTRSCLWTP